MAAFALMLGIILSFAKHHNAKKFAWIFSGLGFLAGCILLGVRVYDPRGMNLILMAFNRKLVVTVAGVGIAAVIFTVISSLTKNKFLRIVNLFSIFALVFVSLMYLVPPVLQYTREFVYFGESGISTNAMLRALGFTIGIFICLLLILSSYEVHNSLRNDKERHIFLFASILIFTLEYMAGAVAALQRLKVLKITDAFFNVSVFDVMIWRGENPNAFLFAQLTFVLIMLLFVIKTHLKPEKIFPNKALLRKEKARLRDCRRWSLSLLFFGAVAVLVVTVLHYYDTKPPAEIPPEP